MRLRRIVAPMIVCSAALACGLLPASASAAPAGPMLVGSVQDKVNLSGAVSVAVSGHYAYSTAYYAGELTAVDISSPTHPVIAGHSAPPSIDARANNVLNGDTVAIAGGYAYVVSKNRNGPCMPNVPPGNCTGGSNDDGSGNALTIFDIQTNPAQPTLVGTVRDPNKLFGAYGIAVQGGYAFVASQGCLTPVGQPCPDPTVGNQFVVINVSNPAAPSIVFSITNPSSGPFAGALNHADSVSLSGHYAYVTASYSDNLTVIDISTPATPAIVARLGDATNLRFANDVTIQSNYAYVASQTGPSGRLTVVDISNPLSLKVVGSVLSTSLDNAYRVRVRGNLVFVSSSHADTVSMIDVSNPASPTIVGTVNDASHLHRTTGLDIALTGRYLIASSPSLPSESIGAYPPFPLRTGGPPSTGTISVIDLDPSPVSVNITSPGAGAQYQQGQVVHAAYSCARGGLIGLASCTGPVSNGAAIDTAAAGKHTFTVTGTDQAGQTGTATVTYTVGGPMITGLRQSARKWREHGPKHAAHKPPLGTTFTITLNQSAKLTLMFTQTARGRLVGGRCVASTKKNRHHRACLRTFAAGKLTINGQKGSNKVAFAGRVNRALLKPGRYTLVVTATAGGITSARHAISFTIVVS